MDPITQRILDQQRAIQNNPNFMGYQPSASSLDQDIMNIQAPANGIAAFNAAPVNQDIMFQDTLVQDPTNQETPPIDMKKMATNVGKKLVADYAIKKLGVDGIKANLIKSTLGSSFMSLNNPITAAFTIGSFLPDSVKGIAGILRNKRAQKAIQKDIMNDMQGKITTTSPYITNMQPTNQDIYRGGGPDPSPTKTSAPAARQSRHTSGSGGLHSGY